MTKPPFCAKISPDGGYDMKTSSVSWEKIFLAVIIGLTVFAFLVLVWISSRNQPRASGSQVLSYQVSDKERPRLKAPITFADLGKIKLSPEKTAEFWVENQGEKTLQFTKVSSSCGCTVGAIEIEGVKSPEFGMHSASSWVGNLEPGKKALIRVIYRPYVMPVAGVVTRDIYLQTNDPEKPNLTFSVKAYVEE